MGALVVIHAEKTYLHNPRRESFNGLVPRIASAIEESITKNEQVYFLAAASNNPYGSKMFPEISRYASKMQFMPAKKFVSQFLETKKRLLDDSVDRAELAGICYYVCLQDVRRLFSGNGGRYGREQYETTAKDMGWTDEEFEKVFETKIDTIIREELTDKV
ncbi:hypothetical protein KY325_02890 [Candidatus Woesearchaeota archaeon]|nr:hypothetical protein [Candidatus Woesearchaeota archaeon]